MSTFSFAVAVEGFDLDSEFQNASIECLDYVAVVGRTGGVTTVDIEIDAPSSVDAFLRVMRDLRGINVTLQRIDLDLVSIPEMAERAAVSRETARLWSTGQRRSGFPDYFTTVGSMRLWRWADVYDWATSAGIEVGDILPLVADEVETLNGALAKRRATIVDGWVQPRATAPVVHISAGRRPRAAAGGWTQVDARRRA